MADRPALGAAHANEHGGRKRSAWHPAASEALETLLKFEDPHKIYHFYGQLGSGGFGTVYLAKRKADKLVVAMKEASEPLQKCKDDVLAEVRLMKTCQNKNIVHLVDAFAHKDRVYIAMLYCDGGSLDKLVQSVVLSEPVIAHVFIRVASGLYYLERQCLVHRDLKPGNILLSRNGEIRIGDLGLMKPQIECAFGHSRAGTPGFRAPEVLLGHGSTTKSDMYSFGCSIYAAFYGAAPYENLSQSALLWKTCTVAGVPKWTGERTRTPSLDLQNLMESVFVLDPEQRASAMAVLKAPFWQLDTVGVEAEVRETVDSGFLETALGDFGL